MAPQDIDIDQITSVEQLKALRGDQFMEREQSRENAKAVEERTTNNINMLTNRIAQLQQDEQDRLAKEAAEKAAAEAGNPIDGSTASPTPQDVDNV